jgi:DNA-binding transcriptional ArsR family regulator
VLRRANLVQARKEGTSVVYAVSDPKIFKLFEAVGVNLSETDFSLI